MICMELVSFLVRALKKAIFQFLKKPLQLASSDFWEVPLVSSLRMLIYYLFSKYLLFIYNYDDS